jgi:hypothetical protein
MKPSKELIERAAKVGFIWKDAYNEFISEWYEDMRTGEEYGQDVYLSDGEYIDYEPIPVEEIMEAILDAEAYYKE